jgi:hypothetical protein
MIMPTIVPFNPQPTANFTFSPTLDNNTYQAVVTWNTYSNRYYLNIYTLTRALMVSIPLIASPDDGNIDLMAGFFNTPIIFRDSSNNFEIG